MIKLLSSGSAPIYVVSVIAIVGMGIRYSARGDSSTAIRKRMAISCITLAALSFSTIITFPLAGSTLPVSESISNFADVVSGLRYLGVFTA